MCVRVYVCVFMPVFQVMWRLSLSLLVDRIHLMVDLVKKAEGAVMEKRGEGIKEHIRSINGRCP